MFRNFIRRATRVAFNTRTNERDSANTRLLVGNIVIRESFGARTSRQRQAEFIRPLCGAYSSPSYPRKSTRGKARKKREKREKKRPPNVNLKNRIYALIRHGRRDDNDDPIVRVIGLRLIKILIRETPHLVPIKLFVNTRTVAAT